jgi:P-type conjugative transfer protein TrbJ
MIPKSLTSSFLSPRSTLAMALLFGASLPGHAGIPTIDVANIVQTTTTAMENVMQTSKQVEQYTAQLQQYQLQMQQYQNMVQNTAAPPLQIWDQAQSTMNSLRSSIDTLDYYKRQLGSLDAYLGKFQDVNYYKNSPCFNGGGNCSDLVRRALLANQQTYQSESQKKANDALFRGLDKQQDALQSDARTLQQLQRGAQDATGQMQALGYANQLASSQSNQLLQIRALLIAQQNAAATRAQAQADAEALRAAGSSRVRSGTYSDSTVKAW